jgi:diguanylate cyclase (GGDEF)-like protein
MSYETAKNGLKPWAIGLGGVALSVALANRRYSSKLEAAEKRYTSLLEEAEQRANMAEQQTMIDPLTGIGNRRALYRDLEGVIARQKRDATINAALAIDLDKFKEVNDTFGHADGDSLLVTVAGVVINSLRESDTLSRLGGDEFIALLSGTSREGAETAAKRILESIDSLSPYRGRIPIGASVGINVFEASSSSLDPDVILARADQALYAAKEAGGNTVRFSRPEPRPAAD